MHIFSTVNKNGSEYKKKKESTMTPLKSRRPTKKSAIDTYAIIKNYHHKKKHYPPLGASPRVSGEALLVRGLVEWHQQAILL